MMLEYDPNGSFQGRLDGTSAELKDGYWIMKNVQISQNSIYLIFK